MLWVGSILFICIKGSSVNYKRFQYLLRRVQTHLPDFSTYLPHKRMLYSTFPLRAEYTNFTCAKVMLSFSCFIVRRLAAPHVSIIGFLGQSAGVARLDLRHTLDGCIAHVSIYKTSTLFARQLRQTTFQPNGRNSTDHSMVLHM